MGAIHSPTLEVGDFIWYAGLTPEQKAERLAKKKAVRAARRAAGLYPRCNRAALLSDAEQRQQHSKISHGTISGGDGQRPESRGRGNSSILST